MLEIHGLHDDLQTTTSGQPEDSSGQAGVRFPKNLRTQTYPPGVHVITNLTSGVRDQNRVNVFINGKYALSLDSRQVIDLHVKVGRQLNEQELQELHQASAFGKLYQRTLEWVLMRPRSLRETKDYLKQRQQRRLQTNRKRIHDELKPLPEIQDDTAQLVLERLVDRGYINDQRFAEFYAENRFTKKGISQKRLRLELRQKGISEDVITAVLEQSARDDTSELTKMIAKKAKRYNQEKLIAYLCRQGFHYQDVIDAVENYYQNVVA